MRYKEARSIAWTLGLHLIGCATLACSPSPVPTNPSVEVPVLSLNKTLRFFNNQDQSLSIPPGTYKVSVISADTLQLTSASAGKILNFPAIPITHTESLTTPYLFLLEEAGEPGHVHLVVLLPDGQGIDAEGRWEEIQTRGIGDLNKPAFTPARRYSGVIIQQGRVTTDADFNEQEAVSSSTMPRLDSNVPPSYGQVTLEQGRIQLDAEARQSLIRKCRLCAKKQ